MIFTYNGYEKLILTIRENGYEFSSYFDYENSKKSCILRHDVDFSLDKALDLARLEKELGVVSTYFILISTDFYNVASKKSKLIIEEIKSCGHEIGLHFDELSYLDENICNAIKKECSVLSDIVSSPVKAVSMHRPSIETLEANYNIEGIVNSYGKTFFKEFKYISDSRMNWKENPYSLIGEFDRLHILTHPFWYSEKEKTIKEHVSQFINGKNKESYVLLKNNLRDLESIMKSGEVK